MAEIVVPFVLQKLEHFISGEISLLLGVKEQCTSLHEKLQWVSHCLKDADRKRNKSDMEELWVTKIRDVCYDVEDVIDSYILHLEQQSKRNFMLKLIGCSRVHNIGKQIQQINQRIEEIKKNKSDFEPLESSHDNEDIVQWRQRRDTNFINDEVDKLLPRAEESFLAKKLIEGDQQRHVIAVTGMGGSGKTTLAKMVYNRDDVKHHFHVRAWIAVSQEYNPRDLLLKLIQEVEISINNDELVRMNNAQLLSKLRECLKKRRYLVVIDDIWHKEAWDEIEKSFPSGNQGSRILITTRNKEVAEYVGAYCHDIVLLDPQQSWNLFCRKVFAVENGCPAELESVGKEIVAKCRGLPLAIALLGGLLKGKEKTFHVWSKMCSSANWQLRSGDSSGCQEILALSYKDLPYYLKSCFLYLGLFPEDSEIRAEKLILLWVAEGFVQPRGEEEMEDVAEDYIEELVQRSMAQVERRKFNGRIIAIRVHDLLRDLAISQGKKAGFLDIVDLHGKNTGNGIMTRPAVRRLGIIASSAVDKSTTQNDQSFRTLLFFKKSGHFLEHQRIKSNFMDNIRMLRILDLEDIGVENLPKEIGKLILLKYLGLRGTNLGKLPSSLGNLFKLQTLDLRGTWIGEIPKTIGRMKELRHLYGISRSQIQSGELNLVAIEDLPRDLVTLQLPIGKRTMVEDLSNALIKWKGLRSLSLMAAEGGYVVSPRDLSLSFHQNICQLNLCGRLGLDNLPSFFPPNLTELDLSHCWLKQQQMEILEKLPNLISLCLGRRSYADAKLVFCAQSFAQLQFLCLLALWDLEEWVVEVGAMPKLRHLVIAECYSLRMLPDGLKQITTLQKIELSSINEEVINAWKEEKGPAFITETRFNRKDDVWYNDMFPPFYFG